MESNCSSNRFNEMNKSSKQRCDSLPINLNCNEMEKSNNKEFFSVTFDGFTVVPTIQESNSMNKLANRPGIFRRQLLVLITLAYGNFWIATCVSLQAPFFPREAELKGATPTQYGFVFGIYELVVCLTCPLFGKLIAWVSPNFLCEVGLFVAGASTVLFGLLDKAPFGSSFIVLAFVIRIVEGIGSAAFMTASYTVMASEFPDKIATTFSLLETCFGLGLILGPTLGGAFYELGGFIMPFAILGIFLLTGGGVTLFLMPTSSEITERKSGNFLKFISDVGILLDALAIMTSLNFIGFNSATLEPHLRQFELSPLIIGCIFVISGGIYAITAPIWGKLCDIGINPKIICLFGSILCCIGLIFIGPLNFINIETKLWLIMTSLVFIGLGISAKLVSAFVSSLHDSIKRRGFPDDISTYGLVSALFFSSCSMGAFIGPSLGGFLLEKIGYRKSTAVVLIADIIMVLLVSLYMIWRKNLVSSNEEREPIIRERSKLYSSSESIKDANK